MDDIARARLRRLAKRCRDLGARLYELGADATVMMSLVEAGEIITNMADRCNTDAVTDEVVEK